MTYLHAIILGFVQGFTEFLPVSSSGHLILTQQFFGLTENNLFFDILVHFGTLLAVIVVFRKSIAQLVSGSVKDLNSIFRHSSSFKEIYIHSQDLKMVTALFVGTIPAVVVGFSVKDTIEILFSSTIPVLIALFFTGLMLVSTLLTKKGQKTFNPATGFIVGVAQALAIIPGISRSGSTISTALFCGINREEAGKFSFLLSIPAILGATLIALLDAIESGMAMTFLGPYIVGTLSAFFSGWISLVFLMKIIKYGKIGYFGFYCIGLVIVISIIIF